MPANSLGNAIHLSELENEYNVLCIVYHILRKGGDDG
jgi:hypothetical protein